MQLLNIKGSKNTKYKSLLLRFHFINNFFYFYLMLVAYKLYKDAKHTNVLLNNFSYLK